MIKRSHAAAVVLGFTILATVSCEEKVAPDAAPHFVKLTSNGIDTIVALAADGTLYGFGINSSNQSGFANGLDHDASCVLRRSDTASDAVDIDLNHTATFQVNTAGELSVWGAESDYDFGPAHGLTVPPGEALPIAGLPPMRKIRAGFNNAVYAIAKDGTVYWWGEEGAKGIDPGAIKTTEPQLKMGLPPIVDLSGNAHPCALDASGGVYCWGLHCEGPCETATNFPYDHEPKKVELTRPAVSVMSDVDISCAVLDDRSLWCWGVNRLGQLARERDTVKESAVPLLIEGLPPVDVARTQGQIVCAYAHGEQLYCWGEDFTNFALWRDVDVPGSGVKTKPFALPGFEHVVDVTFVEDNALCALMADDSIWCIGGIGQVCYVPTLTELYPTPAGAAAP